MSKRRKVEAVLRPLIFIAALSEMRSLRRLRTPAVRVEGAVYRYLVGLIAYRIKILPLPPRLPFKQGAEARYARTLGMKGRDADRKVEPSEGAPGLTLPSEAAQSARRDCPPARERRPCDAHPCPGSPGASSLLSLAAPISVPDHAWLGCLCHVRSIPIAGVFPGG